MNKVIITGRLGQDPEVRYTNSNTAVASLSVATTERYKDSNGEWKEKAEWHKIVCWDKKAEVAEKFLKKGDQAQFEGKLQTREWEDKEGQKRYTTEIVCERLYLLGKTEKQDQKPEPRNNIELDSKFDDMDDDLPF